MKKQYFPLRQADIDGEPDAEDYLSRTIYEPDAKPYDTGLLDKYGNSIFAQATIGHIGFVKFKE